MKYSKSELLSKIKGQLIVSCQALPGEPLYVPEKSVMYLMARAAKEAGSPCIRTSSIRDVAAIKEETGLPVIGIIKINYEGYDSYITPTMKEVDELVAARADIVALDCTMRRRGDGTTINEFIAQIKAKYPDIILMADISTYEEGVNAWKCGVDLVGTTLSGYTDYSPKKDGPDTELVRRLCESLDIPVIAEGKVHTPDQAVQMLEAGAFAVVVGGAITRPFEIATRFINRVKEYNYARIDTEAVTSKFLGIDIGGTAAKMGIIDENGNILLSGEASVAFDNYDTPILKTVLQESEGFLNKNNINPADLCGIGISATGQIDTQNGIVAGSGGNIHNWDGSNLKDAFMQKYRLPVTVVNDANCVALGEKWIGSAKNAKDVIVLTIGTGLGGGIIVNDQILLGRAGFGGELGHFSIHKQGEPCTCGNRGCFEQYASMTALVRSVRRYYEASAPDSLKDREVNGRSIFASVAKGDAAIANIVDAWIHDISGGIVSLVHIFNPELIIIGGGVSAQEELFIAKLETEVMEHVMPNFRERLTLRAATLGNRAGMIGAVYYLMQSLH